LGITKLESTLYGGGEMKIVAYVSVVLILISLCIGGKLVVNAIQTSREREDKLAHAYQNVQYEIDKHFGK
jgi:ABC-type siderophore export system fused ATPase/permease subunit